MRNLLFGLALLVVFASCNTYEKSPSGIQYKVHKGDQKGEKLKAGSLFKFHISFTMPEKDTVLVSTFGRVPAYGTVDTSLMGKYNYMELLMNRQVGDRIEFAYAADSIFKPGVADYPPGIRPRDILQGKITILKTFANADEITKDRENEEKLEAEREKKELQQHIADKKIKATQLPSGVFVEVQNEGTAPKAAAGTLVTLKYTGRLLNGKIFDSNMETGFSSTEPLQFPVGVNAVIAGMDQGIQLFGKGGKGKLYIPAFLAYGPQNSPKMPAYSTLIFDVEVLDVRPQSVPNPGQVNPEQHSADDGHGH